ncbi:MAG: hypothetical protein FWF90_11435 [Promicromonosporaceae bacterium]|nr:hypothetical protein [Promicromonosporaceae bacterium]
MPAPISRRLPILRTPGTPARFERLRFVVDPAGAEGTPGAPSPGADPAAGDPPAGPEAKEDEPLGEGGKKALAAERAARTQAEKDLADLRKQIDDSKKTAEQKAADDLAAAQKAATDSAAKALRYEVAAAKGLDLKLASRLTGATQAELEADADQLKALIGEQKPSAPKPDPSAGSGGDVKPKTLSDAISAHYASS